jgi:hypothetical protein
METLMNKAVHSNLGRRKTYKNFLEESLVTAPDLIEEVGRPSKNLLRPSMSYNDANEFNPHSFSLPKKFNKPVKIDKKLPIQSKILKVLNKYKLKSKTMYENSPGGYSENTDGL